MYMFQRIALLCMFQDSEEFRFEAAGASVGYHPPHLDDEVVCEPELFEIRVIYGLGKVHAVCLPIGMLPYLSC